MITVNVVTELSQHLGHASDSGDAVWVSVVHRRWMVTEADPKPARLLIYTIPERSGRSERRVGISGLGTGDDVEHRGGVPHRPGQHTIGGQAAPVLPRIRPTAHPAAA